MKTYVEQGFLLHTWRDSPMTCLVISNLRRESSSASRMLFMLRACSASNSTSSKLPYLAERKNFHAPFTSEDYIRSLSVRTAEPEIIIAFPHMSFKVLVGVLGIRCIHL